MFLCDECLERDFEFFFFSFFLNFYIKHTQTDRQRAVTRFLSSRKKRATFCKEVQKDVVVVAQR